MKTTITNLPNSRVSIASHISTETLANYKSKALADLQKSVKVDGFRPGSIPENVLIKQVGEIGLLEHMAQFALTDEYPKILLAEKIDAIGRPHITFTKIAPNTDIEFTIETDVMPTVTLGDYKSVAKKINANPIVATVTDEDVSAAILELRQMRAHQAMHDNGVEHHDHNHANIAESELPELNDEFVKSLSASFENVEDFTTKLKNNLAVEKNKAEAEKHRIEMIDGIIAESTIDVPAVMTDFELDKMVEQLTGELANSGLKFDDYLKMINKTAADLRIEWTENANKRAKMQMIFDKISETETIKPTDEEITAEVTKMMDMYRDHGDIDENRVRTYIVQVLTNSAVLAWLENQS